MKSSEAVFFTEKEFMVLCFFCGLEKLRCFELPDPDALTDEDMTMALWNLVNRGFLRSDGKRFLPEKKADLLIEPMTFPSVMMLTPADPDVSQKLCYHGSTVTVLERDRLRKDQIRLESVTFEELREQTEELFGMESYDRQDAELLLTASSLCSDELERLRKGKEEDLRLLLEAEIRTAEKTGRYRFLRGAICTFVTNPDDPENESGIYDAKFWNAIRDMLKGGEK